MQKLRATTRSTAVQPEDIESILAVTKQEAFVQYFATTSHTLLEKRSAIKNWSSIFPRFVLAEPFTDFKFETDRGFRLAV